MAAIIHVKAKSQWRKVAIDNALFSNDDLDGLISLEQLDDYELVGHDGSKKKKKLTSKDDAEKEGEKKKTKNIDKDITSKEISSNELGSEGKKKKKKRKRKKKQPDIAGSIVVGAQTTENLNALTATESNQDKVIAKTLKRKSEDNAVSPKKKQKVSKESLPAEEEGENVSGEHSPVTDLTGMEGWQGLHVPEEVLWALKAQKFYEPTPIQRQVLPSAIRDRMDIVGAAQTGSGKTLAFGIPILHYILEHRKRKENVIEDSKNVNESDNDDVVEDDAESDSGDDVDGLENTELTGHSDDSEEEDKEAIDDSDVDEDNEEDDSDIEESAPSGSDEDLEDVGDGLGCVYVEKDVDFSTLEESAIEPLPVKKGVKTYPLALILEPTRELAIQVRNHLRAAAKFAAIKIEAIVGGLAMQKQQRLLRRSPDVIVATPGRLWDLIQQGEMCLSEIEKTKVLVVDEADRMVEKGHFEELTKLLARMNSETLIEHRHTYVFSATLTMLHSGPQRQLKKKKKIKLDEKQKLETLMKSIGLKAKPKIVDLSPKVGTVETLTEARINCTKEEKDIYLYYFIKQYPGRTLVFANSKDCIRRLLSIFNMLQCCPLPLHADMHQRQRLKNLDRFTANPRGLLLASDVAARGLDIPNVQHVVHYQVPHTVENYVHRSGRTARALKEGLSVMLIGPEDTKNYRKIIHTLNKGEDLPMFPVDQQYMGEYRKRVHLVRQIETKEYRFNKSKRQNNWFQKAAEEIGVDIEDENLLDDLGDEQAQQDHKRYIKQMKAELAMLLKTPVLPTSIGGKYPTKSGKLKLPPVKTIGHNNAILHVKKDKSSQDKMMEHIKKHQTVVKEKKKKQKWKKKKN